MSIDGAPDGAAAGTLFVVSTPIGNLEDISHRALRTLRECSLIAAEDTRVTRKLLSHFDIHTPLTSYHQHTREDRAASILRRLAEGESVALVTDAGTPGISDPGAELISRAVELSVQVVPIPGASAVLAGLVVSGLPTGRFAFDGFPPRAKTDRKEFFSRLKDERRTIVLYEAPTRLIATLQELLQHLGDRQIAVAREITKKFEEVYRGSITGAVTRFRAMAPRGEFVLVVAGNRERPAPPEPEAEDVNALLLGLLGKGISGRDAVKQVAEALDLPKKQVYAALVGLVRESDSAGN